MADVFAADLRPHPGVRFVDPAAHASRITEIRIIDLPVDGLGSALGALSAGALHRSENAYSLVYAGLNGQANLLRSQDAPIWGVPSRAGGGVAFPAVTSRTNVSYKRLL